MADANISLQNDSLGVGEAVGGVTSFGGKIIDAISSAIGTIYEPTKIKRLADAKAYEITTLAKAKQEADAIANSDLSCQLDRVNRMVVARELRRQDNIDYIVNTAIEQIEQKKQVSEENVDIDWMTRFLNIAQDVSDEDMKNLWAQILAGEVAQPKTFSLRTLECLKNISKEEASLFVRVSSFVLRMEDLHFIFRNNELLRSHGINYMDVQKLVEIGLLNTSSDTGIDISKLSNKSIFVRNQNKVGICKPNGNDCNIPIYTFTSTGIEILKLTNISNDDNFFMEVLTKIVKLNCSVEYADIIYDDGLKINYTTPTSKLA